MWSRNLEYCSIMVILILGGCYSGMFGGYVIIPNEYACYHLHTREMSGNWERAGGTIRSFVSYAYTYELTY